MPTIYDVAAKAGVSPSTVSHVLNGTRFVEEPTKERVLQAVAALGYRPNSLARSLRRRESGTIALLVPDNANPFFADVARAIEDVGFAEGYSVVLCNSDGSAAKETAYIELLLSKQVDAFILIPANSHATQLAPILKAEVPVVIVDRPMADTPVDQVLVDNYRGGYLAGHYLAALGHRRIGCIGGPPELSVSEQRLAGFRAALEEAEVPLSPEAVLVGDFRYAGGEQAARQLIARWPDLSALFAANDLMAIGAMQTLRELGCTVPGDVSVIGFDNIDQAHLTLPPLTTIAQPLVELGQVSARLVLERVKARNRPPQRLTLAPRLVERASCRVMGMEVPMKKTGVLHHELAQVIATLGHGDMLVLGDAGLPIPPGVQRIDLAVRPGLPALLDVAAAVSAELAVETLIFAEELAGRGDELQTAIQRLFPQATVQYVPHEALKALTARARAVVRTGEHTPYANVILSSGVTF